MDRLERAIMCDDILRRFAGNKTITWTELRKEFEDGKGGYRPIYYQTENRIKFLLGEGMLDQGGEMLFLTNKGFATLAEIDEYGYEAIENDKVKEKRSQNSMNLLNLAIQIAILIFTFTALWIGCAHKS